MVYPKVSGLSHKEINISSNKRSLRSNTKGYGGKTHHTDSRNSDRTAPSCTELFYHLQFSLQAASPETFGYTLVCQWRARESNSRSQCSRGPGPHVVWIPRDFDVERNSGMVLENVHCSRRHTVRAR
jgi:hypothetical protein